MYILFLVIFFIITVTFIYFVNEMLQNKVKRKPIFDATEEEYKKCDSPFYLVGKISVKNPIYFENKPYAMVRKITQEFRYNSDIPNLSHPDGILYDNTLFQLSHCNTSFKNYYGEEPAFGTYSLITSDLENFYPYVIECKVTSYDILKSISVVDLEKTYVLSINSLLPGAKLKVYKNLDEAIEREKPKSILWLTGVAFLIYFIAIIYLLIK